MTEERRALISVSDKSGLAAMAKQLTELGFSIISTGGTARALREAGLTVSDASAVTGFPEILGGRVKTLHPYLHGPILARVSDPEQKKELDNLGLSPIELVIVNLYPFEETIAKEDCTVQEAIEKIDVGGPTMLRAAAKNYAHVAVVVDPADYALIIEELKTQGTVSEQTRLHLAAKAFNHTAGYDAAIAAYFKNLPEAGIERYPERLTLTFNKIENLRYGENPQQEAAFYANPGTSSGLAAARQLQGKALSFNNLNDLHAAWDLVSEFKEPAAVAVKHTNPCGVGAADNLVSAYQMAFDADPISIFGGVVALNRTVDEQTAEKLVEIFLEVIAAPAFSDEAKTVLAAKKDVRLLVIDQPRGQGENYDQKTVSGGLLIQTIDQEPVTVREGEVVTKREPTEKEWAMLSFAQTVVKHVRSNAIVITGLGQTYGIGAGQTSRIDAARIALQQAGLKAKGAVLGSDAFFPFPDTVEEAAKAGVTAIVQPGGSLKDNLSIELCDQLGLAMVFTGRRYFKH